MFAPASWPKYGEVNLQAKHGRAESVASRYSDIQGISDNALQKIDALSLDG